MKRMVETRKFNEMTEFELDEISSVDFPAQEPARALLMKAREDEELRKRLRLTSLVEGHQHVVSTTPRTGGDDVWENRTSYDYSDDAESSHSHPVVLNDDGTIEIGYADGHTHTVIVKSLTADDLEKSLGQPQEPAGSGGGPNGENPMTKTDDKTAGADEAVEKRIADLEARAEKAERLASLSDVQKAHYGTLSPDAQAEFLGKSAEERDADVEKAAGDDPVVYTTLSGEQIRKSAGSLVLDLAKRADETEKALAVEKAARERDTFVKRAGEELDNLSGSEDAKVALLKAVDGIRSEADRKAVLEILKGANSGVKKAFETAGTVAGDASDAEDQLNDLAQKRADANGITFAKAYADVLGTPEGRRLYAESKRS